MEGLIGKKLGMTSIFTEEGKNIACTIVEAGPCVVTQLKTKEKDGYNAVQVGYGSKKEKHATAALIGHCKAANTYAKAELHEFRKAINEEITSSVGDEYNVTIFEEGQWVDVIGTSKGKGFQGVVKRHGFAGVGQSTHGQHNRLRAPGSIGACSFPARVFKGVRMAGRTGGVRVKAINAQIVRVIPEKNILIISGAIPGYNGSTVVIEA